MTTITEDVKKLYTWGSAEFRWKSLEGGRKWKSTGTVVFDMATTEQVSFADQSAKIVTKKHLENIRFAERIVKILLLYKHYDLRFTDASIYSHICKMYFLEGLALSEGLKKQTSHKGKEAFTAADNIQKTIMQKNKEFVTIGERFLRTLILLRKFVEKVDIAEKGRRSIGLNKEESFSADDFLEKQLALLEKEQIDLAEVLDERVKFVRYLMEQMSVSEFFWKKCEINKAEAVCAFDALLRASGGVLSNISLSDGGLSLKDFLAKVEQAPGYGSFVDYNVGDYEYERALVRLILQSPMLASEPLLYNVCVHVDIDDTDDRGTVTVSDTSVPVRVYYNKHYYTSPEVSITIRSGSTGNLASNANIITTAGKDELGRYFEAELLDRLGNRVTGSFSWTSKGY